MLLSYDWLKEYLSVEVPPPHKLSEELTLLGLEVTEIKEVNRPIQGLAVGEVLEKWKHPNADRLNLTRIRHLVNGQEVIDQVVCGASNIDAGQKIILAKVGTELAPGFVIKKAKIRGEDSCGMVCSREELGKEEKSEGIWVLPPETGLDCDPQTILGDPDYLLDFDITSNRWDAMSALGIAREVAVLLDTSTDHEHWGSFATKEPTLKKYDFPRLPANSRVRVEIESSSDCYRYQGLDITGVKTAPSPDWLAERLSHHGLRPIDNVVDVTNLILREYGQPIHAFDADKIGKVVSIRLARSGEEITILDGRRIKLDPEDLLIADENGPIAMAGVMGGLETGVTATTHHVFLETAVFDPKRVRQTMQRHQISTDAGRYFQHKVDTLFAEEVIKIAGTAIAHLGKGNISTRPIDAFPNRDRFAPKKIVLTRDLLDKTLGFFLAPEEVTSIFTRLKFPSSGWKRGEKGEEMTITVPSYRLDLEKEWDLIEEVARVYGYNNIPITHPRITNAAGTLMVSPKRRRDEYREQIRRLCLSMGFHEILTYPFIENKFPERLGIKEEDHHRHYLKPMNPVWNDVSLLRNNLVFGFLKTIQRNIEKKVVGFSKVFEINKVFSPFNNTSVTGSGGDEGKGDSSAFEHSRLGLAVWGGETLAHWKYPSIEADYAEVSGAVEEIFFQIFGSGEDLYFQPGWGDGQLSSDLKSIFTPGSEVKIVFRGREMGMIGTVANSVKNYFGLESILDKRNIFYAELDMGAVLENLPNERSFKPFSVYPAIHRDLALVMDKAGVEQNIQSILKELPKYSSLLTQVNVADVYEGDNIPAGKKSVVFSLEFTASDKTLKRADADAEVSGLVDKLKKNYNFNLR